MADKHIARAVPAGAAGVDQFVLGIFAWALVGFGNIYYGLARRVLDQTLESLKTKSSIALSRPMIYHAGIQHEVAEMVMEMEAIGPQLDRFGQDWTDGVDYGHDWIIKIVGSKYKAVEGAWKVVDTCLDLSGGFGIFKKSGIERMWRDARLGRFHPANSLLTREFVAKITLGINPDEAPRWG